MEENTKNQFGTIKIHNEVIASIAYETVKDIPGVAGIRDNFRSALSRFLKKNQGSGAIKVEFDENNETTITIPLLVQYGYNFPELAAKIQENVRTAIENSTNIVIKDININIRGIERGQKQ